jgi:ParB-like chromosome segregation protein Spo0J
MTEVKGAGTERKCSGVVTSALTPTDGINSPTTSTEPGPTITDPTQVNILPHPAALLFPMCNEDEFAQLVDNIRLQGLHQAIVLDREGRLLDGRNRWLAVQQLGIPCPTRTYVGDDPVSFVVSENLHRRHLTNKQRAEIAAKLATNTHGGDRRSIKSPNGDLKPTQAHAAALLNVSKRSIERITAASKASAQSEQAKIDVQESRIEGPQKSPEPTQRPNSPTETRKPAKKRTIQAGPAARRMEGAVRALRTIMGKLHAVAPASLHEHLEAPRWRREVGEVADFLRAFARGLRPQ